MTADYSRFGSLACNLRYSTIHIFLAHSPFLLGTPLHFLPLDTILQASALRLQVLLLAYYRLLASDPHFSDRHNWSAIPLIRLYTSHPDISVRYMALQTFVRYKGIQEQVRLEMEKSIVGDMKDVDVPIVWGWGLKEVVGEGNGCGMEMKMLDGWLIRLSEVERLRECEF